MSTIGLPKDYDSFVTTFSILPGSTSFDDLQSKLLFYEQHINYKKCHNLVVHQAFVSTTGDAQGHGGANGNSNNKGNCNNCNNWGAVFKTIITTEMLLHPLHRLSRRPLGHVAASSSKPIYIALVHALLVLVLVVPVPVPVNVAFKESGDLSHHQLGYCGASILVLRKNSPMLSLFEKQGIYLRKYCLNTQLHNRVAKRKDLHILEMVCTFLIDASKRAYFQLDVSQYH